MATATEIEPMYPSLAARPVPARPRVLLVGTLLGSAALVMAYAALIGTYLTLRAGADGPWLPENVVIPLTAPNMAAVTLVRAAMSAFATTTGVVAPERRVPPGLVSRLKATYTSTAPSSPSTTARRIKRRLALLESSVAFIAMRALQEIGLSL